MNFDSDVISVRVHNTMTKYDLNRLCGFLPIGTLVQTKTTIPNVRWQELGLSTSGTKIDVSDMYVASTSGLRGPVGSPNKPSGALSAAMYSNQLETILVGGKTAKLWWRVHTLGHIEVGSTMMLLGYLVFPWTDGLLSKQMRKLGKVAKEVDGKEADSQDLVTDRYIQIWQPLVPSKVGSNHSALARNLFAGEHKMVTRGTSGHEPFFRCQGSSLATEQKLRFDVADRFALMAQQPKNVKVAVLGSDYEKDGDERFHEILKKL